MGIRELGIARRQLYIFFCHPERGEGSERLTIKESLGFASFFTTKYTKEYGGHRELCAVRRQSFSEGGFARTLREQNPQACFR